MPYDQVMHKFKAGTLRSGGGGKVTDRKQAIAIMLSEKKASKTKPEYRARGIVQICRGAERNMIVLVRCIQTGFVVESLADCKAKHFERIEDALEYLKQVLVLMHLAAS